MLNFGNRRPQRKGLEVIWKTVIFSSCLLCKFRKSFEFDIKCSPANELQWSEWLKGHQMALEENVAFHQFRSVPFRCLCGQSACCKAVLIWSAVRALELIHFSLPLLWCANKKEKVLAVSLWGGMGKGIVVMYIQIFSEFNLKPV